MGDFDKTMRISAAGMQVQNERMRLIAQNMANAQTVPGLPGEEPYRRQLISFKTEYDRTMGTDIVAVDRITEDQSAFNKEYRPGHPAADEQGFVLRPNISTLIEAMDMREAQRAYEANLRMIALSRDMLSKTIDMLRGK